MDVIQAIIIGIVQGLTEFLPISSSAHLIFAERALGVAPDLAFDTFLHLGSLIDGLWFFHGDLQHRFIEGLYEDPYKKLAWYVILATIPVGIVGVLFQSQVEELFAGALYVPAFFLFVTGTILYLSQRMNSGKIDFANVSGKESLFMGLGQACAILPGLSRSGTTIAAGLVAGLDKEFAAKFSFILSIPAIIGATIVQVKDIGGAMDANFTAIILGFIAAFIAGYLAIKWVLDLIQNRNLDIFSYYCWAVGIIVFLGSITHIF